MSKKILSLVITALLTGLCGAGRVHAAAAAEGGANEQAAAGAKAAAKVKKNIKKWGIGKKYGVEVRLRDGTKRPGYVTEIEDDHFVVIDRKTGATTALSYAEVERVRRTYAFSKFQKVVIIASLPLFGAMVAGLVTVDRGGQ